MNNFIAGWRLIYTRPNVEKRVASELSRKGLSVFLPASKSLRRWHDRNKIIEVPLFPSYIFVRLGSHVEYFTSMEVEGVLTYVKFGREIARVSDCVVDSLRLLVEGGMNIEVSCKRFETGQKVRISEGCMTGLICEVVETKNEKRILVRVNLLNRVVLATIASEVLVGC